MKSKTRRRIFQASLCILPMMLGAQVADWVQYTNGRHITAIAEEGGYAWIGTTGGLVRVDTLTLATQFFNTANSGLPSNNITAVAVDNQGNKWIGTRGKGLVRFTGTSYDLYSSAVIGSNLINALAFEADTLWVGTNAGIARFDGAGWTRISGANFLPSDTVTSFAFGAGVGWIGTAKGVVQYQSQSPQFLNQTSNLPDHYITSVSVAFDSPLLPWVGMQSGGVGELNGTAWTIHTTDIGLPANAVQSVTVDNAGRVLAGTPNGLGYYDADTWITYDTGNSQIPENTVGRVLWKSAGNKAYVGTITGGLSTLAFSDNSWRLIPTSNAGLRNDAVRGVAIAENGRIGAGSDDYLTYYDGDAWITYSSTALGVAQSGFSYVAMDASGLPWVGTSGQGLLRFDGSTWATYSYPTTLGFPADNNVQSVAVAPNGDVWVATWGGVGRFNGTGWTTYNATSDTALPGDNEIRALAVGSDGTVWISDNTSAGPIKFNGTSWAVQSGAGIGLIPGLSWVSCVTSAGEPWVGTPYSGAALYTSAGQWRQVNTTTSNIPSNQVNSIALDKNGFVWFGTADGLGRFDLPNLIFTDIFKADQITAPSGLPRSYINAVAVGPDNAIYAATDSGLAVYSGFPLEGEPILQTRPVILAFGGVTVGDADTLITVLKNIGTADLIINLVLYPPGVNLLENATYPDTVAAGDSLMGHIQFIPSQAITYLDTIQVFSNAASSPDNYIVTGTGIPSGINEPNLDIRNRMFLYDTLTIGRTRTISTYIRNTGSAALLIDSLKLNVTSQGVYSMLAPAGTSPLSIPVGDSLFVSIRFQPADVVFYGGLLKIVSNSPSSPDSLYINGTGVASTLSFTGDEAHIHTGLYGMITIPYVLADRRIEAVLSDLGPYSTGTWRLYHWLNNRYYEYPEFPSADSLFFRPGVAYWLISNDTLQLDLRNVTATPAVVDTGINTRVSNFRIRLRPGWNMIGNPFAYQVQWGSVLNTASIQAPVVYNVRWREIEGMEPYSYGITELEPWRGYFVYNRTLSPIVIQVPPFNNLPKPSGPRVLAGDEFILKAQAKGIASKLRTGKISVGMLRSSDDGTDDGDYFEAPPIKDGLRMSIMDGKNRYAGNFKAISSEGAAWDFAVSTPGDGEKAKITFDGIASLPKGFRVFLLDRDRGCVIPVQNGEADARLEGAGKASQLRLIVGTEEFAEQKSENIPLVPYEFALKQNYPNPFNPETHILYSLSQKSLVKLTVYNTIGRKVRTLFRGEQGTGLYPMTWDGRDDAGLSVNSGVYVCRLEAGQFAISKKMILVR